MRDTYTAITAPISDVIRIFGAVSQHASTDTGRPVLCQIEISGGTISATNSYTAAIFTPAVKLFDGDARVMVNAREILAAITTAGKTLKGDGAATMTLAIDGDSWNMSAAGETATATATGKLYNGDMPNLKQILAIAKEPAADKYLPTSFNGDYLDSVIVAHSKLVGKTKNGVALTLKYWAGNTKPVLFETATDLGVLEQLIMPIRDSR